MFIFHSDWYKFHGKFITPKELAYRWGVPEDTLKSIEHLCPPVTIDGEARYHFFDIIKFENWFYFTKEDLAKRWNIPDDKLENLIGDLIRTETIDGEALYPILRVITFENQNLIKQEELAKMWEIPFDEIRKIDEFVGYLIIDGKAHYSYSDISQYEQSPEFIFRKDEEDLPI